LPRIQSAVARLPAAFRGDCIHRGKLAQGVWQAKAESATESRPKV